MTIEDRLRDALGEYREQVEVSPALLDRVEARARRRVPPMRTLVTAAAAVAAAVVVVVVVTTSGPSDDARIASHDVTRASFLAAANRACEQTQATLREVPTVFPTATALAVVAEQRTEVARATLHRVERLRGPRSVRSAIEESVRVAYEALFYAEQAQRAAESGDVPGAQRFLHDFDETITYVQVELGDAGAKQCAATGGS